MYSVEGYDLTTIMLKGIDSGVKDRAGMVNYVKRTAVTVGLHYKWNDKGELASALDLDLQGPVANSQPASGDPCSGYSSRCMGSIYLTRMGCAPIEEQGAT